MLGSTMRPDGYHGVHARAGFFEGWYVKLVSADRMVRLAVDFASSLHTVDHTQAQKTTARMSQPIKGADRPAPAAAATAPPTIAAPRDTSSFVRAEVDNRGTP